MGVDARAILTSNPSPIEVMDYIQSLVCTSGVSITPSSTGFVWVNFDWINEPRMMACFYDGECMYDYKDIHPFPACFVSLGKWGFSDVIIMNLVERFGGYYQLNDCADEWSKLKETK